MRIIGLDIHRAFAEAVAWQDGKLKRIGRIDMRRDRLAAFAATLSSTDVVVVEGEDLRVIERDLARSALADVSVARLMTIPGIDMVVALALVAAIGNVQRFGAPLSRGAPGAQSCQFGRKLRHREVACLGHSAPQEVPVRIQLRGAPAALTSGRKAPFPANRRHELHHEGDRYREMMRGRIAGMAHLDEAYDPFPQIQRVGFGHGSPPPDREGVTIASSRIVPDPVRTADALVLA